MGFIKKEQLQSGNKNKSTDKTMYIANEKIDRHGDAWKKSSLWIRKEHLGKLKVISHFKNKPILKLIDKALEDYIGKIWDNSMAIKKMVKK
jgi:hypothetical protein